MKIKVLIYAVCIFLLVLLQSTLLNYIRIYDVKPNLLLVFVICVALLQGNVEGSIIGFLTGLTQDMLFGRILGFYAILGLYTGLIIGSFNKRLYRDNFFVVTFFTFVVSLVYEELVYLLNTIKPVLDGNADLLFALKNVVLPEAIYNSVASIFIYILVIKLDERFEELVKTSRKY